MKEKRILLVLFIGFMVVSLPSTIQAQTDGEVGDEKVTTFDKKPFFCRTFWLDAGTGIYLGTIQFNTSQMYWVESYVNSTAYFALDGRYNETTAYSYGWCAEGNATHRRAFKLPTELFNATITMEYPTEGYIYIYYLYVTNWTNSSVHIWNDDDYSVYPIEPQTGNPMTDVLIALGIIGIPSLIAIIMKRKRNE